MFNDFRFHAIKRDENATERDQAFLFSVLLQYT